jgi:hypothetical protein
MEFLCGSEFSLSTMSENASRAINTGRGFAIISGGRGRTPSESRDAISADFWPDVSSQYSREELVRAASENSPGRVFLEVFLVLGIAGLAAVVAILWIPILS